MALAVKNSPASAGNRRDLGLIPGSGRSPGGGHGNPLQNSSLRNPVVRGTWQATVHRVTKSQTDWSDLAHTHSATLSWKSRYSYNQSCIFLNELIHLKSFKHRTICWSPQWNINQHFFLSSAPLIENAYAQEAFLENYLSYTEISNPILPTSSQWKGREDGLSKWKTGGF